MDIGPLDEGTYTIELIGRETTYFDTFHVPTDAPDSLFQFQISLIEKGSGEWIPNCPVVLHIWPPGVVIDIFLYDTTDSSGYVEFNYMSELGDSVLYEIDEMYNFPSANAIKGIPEVITLGIP